MKPFHKLHQVLTGRHIAKCRFTGAKATPRAPFISPCSGLSLALLFLAPVIAGGFFPEPAFAEPRAPREMRIHRVGALGLEIWVENQPPWEAEVMQGRSLPVFVVQSPSNYYPPAVMTYVGMPSTSGGGQSLEAMSTRAIRRAAWNYGLGARRLSIRPEAARYGALSGYEATFDGVANGEAVQVKVFVGQAPGRSPVAMQVYTLRGKLAHLSEPIRRAWNHIG